MPRYVSDSIDEYRAADVVSKMIDKLMDAASIEVNMDADTGDVSFLVTTKSAELMCMFTGEGETPMEAYQQLSADIRDFMFGPTEANKKLGNESASASSSPKDAN